MRHLFTLSVPICAMAVAVASFAGSVKASSLTLVNVGNDDVTSTYLSFPTPETIYTGSATGGLFQVTGSSTQLISPSTPFTGGSFTLDVFLTATGAIDTNKLGSDLLKITGDNKSGGSSSNILYQSGTPIAFGFDPSNDNFEFIFAAGPAPQTFGANGPIGVNVSLSGVTGYTGNFSSDVIKSSMGQIDTFTVAPLPSAVLMGLGLLAVVPLIRRLRIA